MQNRRSFKVGDLVRIIDIYKKNYSLTGEGSIGRILYVSTKGYIDVRFHKNNLTGNDAEHYHKEYFEYPFKYEEIEILKSSKKTHLPEFL